VANVSGHEICYVAFNLVYFEYLYAYHASLPINSFASSFSLSTNLVNIFALGGSSSKGGKKGTNDDRRKLLVEKTLKQAQRKLNHCECQGRSYCAHKGDSCDEIHGPWCTDSLTCWKNKVCECVGFSWCAKRGEYCNNLFGPYCTDNLECNSDNICECKGWSYCLQKGEHCGYQFGGPYCASGLSCCYVLAWWKECGYC